VPGPRALWPQDLLESAEPFTRVLFTVILRHEASNFPSGSGATYQAQAPRQLSLHALRTTCPPANCRRATSAFRLWQALPVPRQRLLGPALNSTDAAPCVFKAHPSPWLCFRNLSPKYPASLFRPFPLMVPKPTLLSAACLSHLVPCHCRRCIALSLASSVPVLRLVLPAVDCSQTFPEILFLKKRICSRVRHVRQYTPFVRG
jgi:hypothetical protein